MSDDYELSDPDELEEYVEELEPTCKRCNSDEHVEVGRQPNGVVTVSCTKCGSDIAYSIRKDLPQDAAPLISLPLLRSDGATLQEVGAAARALTLAAMPNPEVFRFGNDLVTVSDEGKVEELSGKALQVRLATVATWRNSQGLTNPPMTVVDAMRAAAGDQRDIPRLDRVVTVPTLLADGRILTEPGYDAESATYLHPTVEVDVPDEVTEADVADAVDMLLQNLYDFPFASQADRANALAATIQPFVRATLGPCPLYVFDAPAPGTGKSLAASCVLMPGCGQVRSTGWAASPNEQEKKLLSELREAPAGIKLDNVTGTVTSPSLEAILTDTSGFWSGRVLKTSTLATVPIHQTWVLTANNAHLGTDLARRTVWIRLDAKVEQPETRTGPAEGQTWLHLQPLWAEDNRGALVTACLTLVRWWLQLDRPGPVRIPADCHRGSFERWEHTLGGILEAAGIEGFLENAAERTREQTGSETAELATTLKALEAEFGVEQFTSQMVLQMVQTHHLTLLDGASSAKSVGRLLAQSKGKVADGLALRVVTTRGANAWRLERTI